MDAPRYFARRYFAGRYWPPATDVPLGYISGSFAGSSTFVGQLTNVAAVETAQPAPSGGGGGVWTKVSDSGQHRLSAKFAFARLKTSRPELSSIERVGLVPVGVAVGITSSRPALTAIAVFRPKPGTPAELQEIDELMTIMALMEMADAA